LHMAHLADCDRCRKILSNLLVMNSEAAPVSTSPGVITIAERAPWYKGLFLFPNLAYLMGSLVLIFSAFLGYTIFQKSGVAGDTTISQANAPAETRGGPNFQEDFPLQEGSAPANTMANSAANVSSMPSAFSSNSNAAASGRSDERGPAADMKAAENNFTVDGAGSTAESVTVTTPPASASATQPAFGGQKAGRDKDDSAKEKAENKIATDVTTSSDVAKNDLSINARQQSQLPSPSAQSGPMRNNESQYNRQLENLERKRAAAPKKSIAREEESAAGTRAVGGKTFERKQGVWYDVAYQGRPTINVRRGSAEFNKLDAGLKSIANSLSGTAVIVWGAKAYRIQ